MQARHLQAAAEPLLRIDRYKAQYTAKITVFALIFLQTYTSATNKIKVESTWVAGYIPRWFTRLQTVTHLWYCRSGEEQSHKSPTPGDGPDEYRRAVKSILIYLENTSGI